MLILLYRIVQTDQGTEFKGIVQMLKFTSFIVGAVSRKDKMILFKIMIVYLCVDREISPDMEESYTLMTFDMLKEFDSFLKQNVQEKFDWVTALPVYQHIYNTTYHKSLGNQLHF